MSSGTQVELDWAGIDAARGGERAAGAGGARGTGPGAPSEPGTYLSDEEILGMEPVGQASACLPGDAEHRLKPALQTPGPESAKTAAISPGATNDTDDLRAFREMFPGGAGEARALRQAAQEAESLRASAAEVQQAARAVEQIDAAIFSGDARAQGEVVAELARANPAAFRQLFAEAAKWYFGAQQEAGGSPPSPNGGYGGVAVARVFRPGGFSPGAQVSMTQQNTPASEEAGYSSAGDTGAWDGRAGDSIAGRTPSASHESRLTNPESRVESHPPAPKDGYGGQARQSLSDSEQAGHGARDTGHESRVASNSFDAAAYASFERGTNDAVARDVRAAIGDTLARVLPDGVADGAARRIGEDIFHEIHRALAADRALSEQVASLLRSPAGTGQGWRFSAGEQQRVASLLAGRAPQLVPSVARRVVGEWTGSVLGAAGARAARQAAAASRVDIGAPGGVPDSMPLRPVAARGVNYAAMSDDEILSM